MRELAKVRKDVIDEMGGGEKRWSFPGSRRMLPIYSKRRCSAKSLLMIPLCSKLFYFPSHFYLEMNGTLFLTTFALKGFILWMLFFII